MSRRAAVAAALLAALALAGLIVAGAVTAQGPPPDGGPPPAGAPPGGGPPPAEGPPPPPVELQGPPVVDQNFVAVAVGRSRGTLTGTGVDLTLDLDFTLAPYGLRELAVTKTIDMSTPPPPQVRDGVYTLTATNGDTVAMATQGIAVDTASLPDGVFEGADEEWSVTSGTGRFEGASGEGKLFSAVSQTGARSSVVLKYFVGRLDLEDG